MAFIYTRSQLLASINGGVQGRIGILVDKYETANSAVREVLNEIDTSSTLRSYSLAPKLFNGVYDYSAPSDLKSSAITDIPPQVKRSDGQWFLVSPEEFDRTKGFQKGQIAIDEYNGLTTLRIATNFDDQMRAVSELDGLNSGGGTWTATGDLINLAADLDDYLCGSGSLSGDIGSGGTTSAGIQNLALNSSDITVFMGGNGSAFAYVKINDPTDLTSYTLRLGSSSSNYYSKTVTVQNNNNAFVAGWNLLRFDLTSLTSTGSPDKTRITYAALFMTKTAGKISETAYKFDSLVLRKGGIYNVRYYSRFGWQSAAGAYKELSTSDSDLLVCDSNEYDLYVLKGRIKANIELKEWDVITQLQKLWETQKQIYVMNNPSLQMIMTDEYYSYRDTRNTQGDNNIIL